MHLDDSRPKALSTLLALLQIAHHLPGRVRLKLSQSPDPVLTADSAFFSAFFQSLEKKPAIRSLTLNPLARSCTIEYDPERIPPQAWRDLLDHAPSPEASILKTLLADCCPNPPPV